jgi:hypothetical protein
MRLLMVIVVVAGLSVVAAGAAQADPDGTSWGPATPNFNLEVVLQPVAGGPADAFGLVMFRQPKDADKIVYLDTWIRGLEPNHGYYLERRVDTNVNGDCTGTTWVTLGLGPNVEAITTDDRGTGRAPLYRSVATVATGTEFDIQFHVIDASTSAVVLESGCYEYVVSQ